LAISTTSKRKVEQKKGREKHGVMTQDASVLKVYKDKLAWQKKKKKMKSKFLKMHIINEGTFEEDSSEIAL
jgi:hypothetical protein